MLVAWLCSLGYDADSLPELRRLIGGAGSLASLARRQLASASESALGFELVVKRDALEAAASSDRALVAARSSPVG